MFNKYKHHLYVGGFGDLINYGTIFVYDNDGTNTIKSDDDSTNVTVNNFKGGHIYHTSESAVVVVGGSATLTNSGKIENKDGPSQNAITLSTVELNYKNTIS